MRVEQRIQTCRLLEKMRMQKDYSKRLGLEDVSTIHGRQVTIQQVCAFTAQTVRK